jgi:hypothetical protein
VTDARTAKLAGKVLVRPDPDARVAKVAAKVLIKVGGAPPVGVTVQWWDSAALQSAEIAGWWDGAAIQAVDTATAGWWDGAAIQPLS